MSRSCQTVWEPVSARLSGRRLAVPMIRVVSGAVGVGTKVHVVKNAGTDAPLYRRAYRMSRRCGRCLPRQSRSQSDESALPVRQHAGGGHWRSRPLHPGKLVRRAPVAKDVSSRAQAASPSLLALIAVNRLAPFAPFAALAEWKQRWQATLVAKGTNRLPERRQRSTIQTTSRRLLHRS